MTYEQAMKHADKGKSVREATMNARWCVRKIGEHYYAINPVLGSNYSFTPSDYYKNSKKWEIMK